MCGIAGIWWPEGHRQAEAEAAVAAMAARLHHRGPDARGVWADGAAGIALGHTRLSILDLSPAGAQPMVSASGRYIVVFNGEIYNHLKLRRELEACGAAPRWRGHSDTETLLALIERYSIEEALDRATGMFALAVWDRNERTLTLARDPLGEKPLYFGRAGSALVFASELKALRAFPDFVPQIDRQAVAAFLRFGYVPGPGTIWQGIRKLPAGNLIRFRQPLDKSEPKAFWSLAEVMALGRAEPLAGDWKAVCDTTEAVLADVVESQLISDVPIGVFPIRRDRFLARHRACLYSIFSAGPNLFNRLRRSPFQRSTTCPSRRCASWDRPYRTYCYRSRCSGGHPQPSGNLRRAVRRCLADSHHAPLTFDQAVCDCRPIR